MQRQTANWKSTLLAHLRKWPETFFRFSIFYSLLLYPTKNLYIEIPLVSGFQEAAEKGPRGNLCFMTSLLGIPAHH